MRIQATSDLHGYLPELNSHCDLVLICGDIIPLSYQTDMEVSKIWLKEKFKPWAEKLDCDKVLLVAGNHDFYMERKSSEMKDMFKKTDKVTYLKNESYEYNGKLFFGSPYCKIFGNWAFMREPETLAKKFSEIPNNVDVLFTHDAPYGCSDIIMQDTPWTNGEHIGNPQLATAIIDKEPKICLHGHLHSTNHDCEYMNNGKTQVYNVSYVDESYDPAWLPLKLEI